MVLILLEEFFFAAIAATGFSLVTDPPKRAVFLSAIAAGCGRALRVLLMSSPIDMGIIFATFFAAVAVGFVGLFFANKARCAMEVVAFPALLPMIPGMYAYHTIIALVEFSNNVSYAQKQELLVEIFNNGIYTIGITVMLAVGVTLVHKIFYEKSFTLTRKPK